MHVARLTNQRHDPSGRPPSFLHETLSVNSLSLFSPAYVLRRAYSDRALFRVRRSSDSTTTDIGSRAGFCDVAALAAFCAGTNGFVSRIYNQNSATNDYFDQTTASKQAKIWDATTGLVTMGNGKPAMLFDGSDDFYDGFQPSSIGFSSTGNIAVTAATTAKIVNTTSRAYLCGIGNSNTNGFLMILPDDDDDASPTPNNRFTPSCGNFGPHMVIQDCSQAHYYIGLKEAGAQQGANRGRQSGIELTPNSTTSPTTNLNFQNVRVRWGTTNAITPVVFNNFYTNFLSFWPSALSGSDIAAVEREMRRHCY